MAKGQSTRSCVSAALKKKTAKGRKMRKSEAYDTCSKVAAMEKKDGKKYKIGPKTKVKVGKRTYK